MSRPGDFCVRLVAFGTLCASALGVRGVRAQLPTPCAAGACEASGPTGWVTSGEVAASVAGSTLTLNQQSASATLNWASFDIGSTSTVKFRQPDSSSTALNRIFQQSPSRIAGSLQANGRVYLINRNGIVFGDGAQVNVGGLIASSLDLTPAALQRGIALAANDGQPAFSSFLDASGKPLSSGSVEVQAGATLRADGGQIMLFAPVVTNEGRIETPDGQTVLAAGTSIYLATSSDVNLRGLVVEVDGDGTVTNGSADNAGRSASDLVGRIAAERGDVSLVGLAVNQQGRVSATTSVRENGSIHLLARQGVQIETQDSSGSVQLRPSEGGDLVLGVGSVTEVRADTADPGATVDVNTQPLSRVEIDGAQVSILDNATVAADSGRIGITARSNPQVLPEDFSSQAGDSRLYLASGAKLDTSGLNIELPIEKNLVSLELRGNELRDSPVQRDGALRGQTVTVDIRAHGTREDGTAWQGTPIADTSGAISGIQRSVGERSLSGGSISLASEGQVIAAPGSVVDVSGGSINYQGGYVQTSRLLGENGDVIDIANADPNQQYSAVIDSYTVAHPRWGVTEDFPGYGVYEAGYVEGKDAGSLSVIAPQLLLDGDFKASVVRGPFQRLPADAALVHSLYRPFDQVPLGGEIVLGSAAGAGSLPNYVLGDLSLAGGSRLAELGQSFDPRRSELPEDFASSLPPGWTGRDKATRLRIYSDGSITVPKDTRLDLPPGSEVGLTAAVVRFDGELDSPSGTVDILSRRTAEVGADGSETGLQVAGATIDVAGRWINDSPQLDPAVPPASLYLDGGSVSLRAAEGPIDVDSHTLIDVSGGAWQAPDGSIRAGAGGGVAVATTPTAQDVPTVLHFAPGLKAFALHDGGTLAISASSICVGSADCGQESGALWLRPSLFLDAGFGAVSLTANDGAFEISRDAQIVARQLNWTLSSGFALAPSGTPLEQLTTVTELPRYLRHPTDLAFSLSYVPHLTQFIATNSSDAPSFLFDEGARIDADPNATVEIKSNTRLEFDGSIYAPAGTVRLGLTNTLPVAGFLPDQAIWLGRHSNIDVSGVALLKPNAAGLRDGDVLDGGHISVTAGRGYIVTAPGSELSLDGTEAMLDLPSGTAHSPSIETRSVASNGGLLELTAAEGMLLGGDMSAHPGGAPGAIGGRLSVTLDGGLRGADPRGDFEPVFPLSPRRIELGNQAIALTLSPLAPIPTKFDGIAQLGADQVQAADFFDVDLTSRSLVSSRLGATFLAAPGQIALMGDVRLQIPGALSLDAASIDSGGGHASLAADYVGLGHSEQTPFGQEGPTVLAAGTGTLDTTAALVELIGNLTLQHFAAVTLDSAGDLRLRGVQETTGRSLDGAMLTTANVALSAQQIYPTTLTNFLVQVEGDDGRIQVSQAAGSPADVLAAGGSVRMEAAHIVQGGTLRSPFGSLTLSGNDVTLLPGSLTSTSLDGALVPFGTLQGGFDWTVALQQHQTLVFRDGAEFFPSARISLDGQVVDLQPGATLDVSGGGDLLAYEFVPGTGGSEDFLSPTVSPNTFAILPGLNLQFAPYDPVESLGVSLSPGDSVFLNGVGSLKSGFYTLLPARYALLPGAYLVTRADGYRDILSDQRFVRGDGGVVVAGYDSISDAAYAPARTEGYEIRPGTAALAEAQYDTTTATEFFGGTKAPYGIDTRLPQDAGVVALNAGQQLALGGQLQAAAEGRGAEVELSSAELNVVGSNDGSSSGAVNVAVSDLESLNAESILLGGVRTPGTNAVTPTASRVEVAAGVTLAAPELLLVGRDEVDVRAGAVLEGIASGRQSEPLTVIGDSGVIRVAGGAQVPLIREQTEGSSGSVVIDSGALVKTAGSAIVDASLDTVSNGRFDVSGGDLQLGAARITLGTPAEPNGGLVLDPATLSSLNAANLDLVSRNSIDFVGDVSLSVADTLALTATSLRGAEGSTVALKAQTIELNGGSSAGTPSGGSASLDLSAGSIRLAGGEMSASGFGELSADAGAVEVAGSGHLSVGGGLNVSTAGFAVDSGMAYGIRASGEVSLLGKTAEPVQGGGLGGQLSVDGASVVLDTRISAPSGRVELSASGDVDLGQGAAVDVGGRPLTFDSQTMVAPGGEVSLSSASGHVALAAGSTIDVSAPQGSAGKVDISAPQGEIELAGSLAGTGEEGGSAWLDGETLGSLDALFDALGAGGFRGDLRLRQRGPGDLVLGEGRQVSATDLQITADQGGIEVDRPLDVSSNDEGEIGLYAYGDVRSGSAIDASGSDGRVVLSSVVGGVDLGPSSSIRVGQNDSPAAGLLVSVSRDRLATLLDADSQNDAVRFDGTISGGRVDIEGIARYAENDGSIGSADVAATDTNPLFSDAATFMAGAPAIASALGVAGDPSFHVLPGIEMDSPSDLTLDADWNLFDWRFSDSPGILTVRAAGDLVFAHSLSDGFDGVQSFELATTGDSWSYRLAAGADLSSANPLALQSSDALIAGTGNLVVQPGIVGSATSTSDFNSIRTGDGRIDLAAGRDLTLGNRASTIYTAGIATDGVRLTGRGQLGDRAYPDAGGDISIFVQHDVVGAPTNQLVTDWLWRTGQGSDQQRPAATGWTVAFERFEQNIGALGGGHIDLLAGGDLLDLSLNIPSVGRQVGGTAAAENKVEIAAGGDLDVRAGGSVLGGSFYVGQGEARIYSGGDLASGSTGLAPVLALGDGRFDVTATGDLTLEAVVNPTLLPQGQSQPLISANPSIFSTYADSSAVDLQSIAGNIDLVNGGNVRAATLPSELTSMRFLTGSDFALQLYPPSLLASAFTGDIEIPNSMTLFPSPHGNLELLAAHDVVLGNEITDVHLIISDADPSLLPSIASPDASALGATQQVLTNPYTTYPEFHAPTPIHEGDPTLARVVALKGSIVMEAANLGRTPVISSAKPIRLVAGGDIDNISLEAQNVRRDSVTSLVAGRDITFPLQRVSNGSLTASNREIQVSGPGELSLVAGRNIDLETSKGISTIGNLRNPALPNDGAGISLLAGVGGSAPDYAGFTAQYLDATDEYSASLIAYLASLGLPATDRSDALVDFHSLPLSEQLPLIEAIFFSELRKSGRAAAQPGSTNGDFTVGFDALEALFPGSNPGTGGGESNPYLGDLDLFFSRVYTLAGGDISLLVPGGSVNAGLATPPAAFGISKSASELGIVAQSTGSISALSFGDFEVNESRVFAADGGDILIWSTRGDIDAGRGAKTAISAPPPQISFDKNGNPQTLFSPALTGSGIQTLATTAGIDPGSVDLFAPHGVVDAGDAGIVAGNLTIAATAVLGAENIHVSGVSVGVPVDTGGLAASLSGISAVASGASNTATSTVAAQQRQRESATPLSDSALSFLDVFVTGFGGEGEGSASTQGNGQTQEQSGRQGSSRDEPVCDPQKENCPNQ